MLDNVGIKESSLFYKWVVAIHVFDDEDMWSMLGYMVSINNNERLSSYCILNVDRIVLGNFSFKHRIIFLYYYIRLCYMYK